MYSGAVEIHRDASDWTGHGHHQDDRYNGVILHAVLSGRERAAPHMTRSGRPIPLLLLGPYLDPGSFRGQPGLAGHPAAAGELSLPCSAVNELMAPDLLRGWLARLGVERAERKSRRWGRRLEALLDEVRDPGRSHTGAIADGAGAVYAPRDFVSPVLWDQALYEALMEGLGYAKNRPAFRVLARAVSLASLRRIGLDATSDVLAVLFGAARLLPPPESLEDPLAQRYAADLRDRWRLHSHAFPPAALHATDWLFFRLRPFNFPTARIAAFAHALPVVFRSGFRGCLDILRSGLPPGHIADLLRRALIVRAGGFWRYRTSFDGLSSGGGSAIGRMRATELIINAVLPLSLRFAATFSDAALRAAVYAVMERRCSTPAHRLLDRLRTDLFRENVAADSPLLYQGAIELYGEYCARLRCRECAVGAACGFIRSSAASSWRRERECCSG